MDERDDESEPLDPDAKRLEAIEVKLIESEHRWPHIIRNFVERKQWPEGDTRRRGAWLAALWRVFAPATIQYHSRNRSSLYCYDEGGDGIVHYEGGAAIDDRELITDEGIDKLMSRHVWIVDTQGGRWGYRYVPKKFAGRLLRTATFREAFGVQGTLVIREYEVKQ